MRHILVMLFVMRYKLEADVDEKAVLVFAFGY